MVTIIMMSIVNLVQQVQEALQVLLVQKVLPGQVVQQVPRVQLVPAVLQDLSVLQVQQGHLGLQAPPVPLVQSDQPVQQEPMD